MVICLAFTGQSDAKVDRNSIVGIWLFEEGTGDIAKDFSAIWLKLKFIYQNKAANYKK